jgi:FkbM family methyltransferase
MIDVGAHHGSSCMRFAREGWQVIAFEPDSVNREAFEENLADEWDVHVDVRALSDHETSGLAFYRSEVSTGISGLHAFHESHDFAESVDSTTLRQVQVEYGIDHVSFLKTDTEGHDLSVLRGYGWDIDRPDVIVCEFDDSKCEAGTAQQQAELLFGLGYDVVISEWHAIIQFGLEHDFRGLWLFQPGDQFENVHWGNMLALRPGLVEHLSPAIDQSVELRLRSLWATHRSMQAAPELGGPTGTIGTVRTLARRSLRRNLKSIQRLVWKRIPAKIQPLARQIWKRVSALLRWYLTPSGLLLLALLPLLAAGFLVNGFFGVAGTLLLGGFLPYRFAREKGIAARTSGAAFNAAKKSSNTAYATKSAIENRMNRLSVDTESNRNRLIALARSLEETRAQLEEFEDRSAESLERQHRD